MPNIQLFYDGDLGKVVCYHTLTGPRVSTLYMSNPTRLGEEIKHELGFDPKKFDPVPQVPDIARKGNGSANLRPLSPEEFREVLAALGR